MDNHSISVQFENSHSLSRKIKYYRQRLYQSDDTLSHPIMTGSDGTLGIQWGACEECGADKPDVLRIGPLTDRRTLCRECRREDRCP